MSGVQRKLDAIKKYFKKKPKYKKFENYDPRSPFPGPGESYKRLDSPKPPQKGGRKRKQTGGRRRKLKGGKRRKQTGGKRRKHRGGRRRKR